MTEVGQPEAEPSGESKPAEATENSAAATTTLGIQCPMINLKKCNKCN